MLLKNPLVRAVRTLGLEILRAPKPSKKVRVDYEMVKRYIIKCIGPRAVFVECGPATGASFEEFVKQAKLQSDHCYLIEACPQNTRILKEKFPGCHVSNFAVTAERGEIPFYIINDPKEPGSSRSNSINEKSLLNKNLSGLQKIKVPSIPLSEYFQENDIKQCHYLHVNIEGAEYEVFTADISFLEKVQFLYLDMHHGLYLDKKTDQEMVDLKYQIYDRLVTYGFTRIAGYQRKDIPLCATHMTFIWENDRFKNT